MGCTYNDSTDKIFMYITSLVKGEVNIDGRIYHEKKIDVSPLILREISCVRHCGACCPSFTLDYLPSEAPEGTEKRIVRGKEIYTYPFTKGLVHCEKLSLENGDCLIHTHRPFSCDFEMLRFKQYKNENKVLIGTFPFGRCWALTQYNGTKGGLCVTKSYSPEYKEDVIRKLTRLKDWIDYYGVETYINQLIDTVKDMTGYEKKVITLNEHSRNKPLF